MKWSPTRGRTGPGQSWSRATVLAVLACAGLLAATRPAAGWSFAVLADARGEWVSGTSLPTNQWWVNIPFIEAACSNMVDQGVDLVIHPNDSTYGFYTQYHHPSMDYQYTLLKQALAPLTNAGIPIFSIRANHEAYQDPDGTVFRAHFAAGLPTNGPPGEVGLTYSFVTNNALFIGLDAYLHEIEVPEINQPWLDQQLAAATSRHVFVYSHPAAFQCLMPTTFALQPAKREAFWNSLGAANVRMYFCGHDHMYNRGGAWTNGHWLYQMVSGAGAVTMWSWTGDYPETNRLRRFFAGLPVNGYLLVTVSNDIVRCVQRCTDGVRWFEYDPFEYNAGPGTGILIDHSSLAAINQISPDTLGKIRQLRWFFAHATVGGDIVSGLQTLQAADSNRYPLAVYNWPGSDPRYHGGVPTVGAPGAPDYRAADATNLQNGRVYDCLRGNPGWETKLTCAANSMGQSGWRAPAVNIVMDKLCWTDLDADADEYLRRMDELEGMYPDTLLVYCTLPLTVYDNDEDNYRRTLFNRRVRDWAATRHRVLLDLADIEAHDTNNVVHSYLYEGLPSEQLWSGFAADEGQLNAAGQTRQALAWYALAAALFAADRDADGQSDGDELIAGTCPTNPASMLSLSIQRGAPLALTWPGVSNRYYSVVRFTNLTDLAGHTVLLTNQPSAGATNHYQESGDVPAAYYQLKVRQ